MEEESTCSLSNILCFKNEDGKIKVESSLIIKFFMTNDQFISPDKTKMQMVPLVQKSVESLVKAFHEKAESGESFEFFRCSNQNITYVL